VVNLSKIHVIIQEEELEVSPPKKPKKNYDISHKSQDVWATQLPWPEMLRSEIGKVHCVKCKVCSFVKGKDVILRPKVDTLEKHVRKTRVVRNMSHLCKK
jgi:hypothetical protein